MRRHPILIAILLSALSSGCGSGNESRSDSAALGAPESFRGDAGTAVAPAKLTSVARAVVRTAGIEVTVDDTAAAADRVVVLARTAGGRVDSDSRSRDGEGRASLVLRVPPDEVGATLTALSRLGTEIRRDVGDKDVTEQTVDLASRMTSQRASVERVRALLARATSLAEITTIEGELTRREAELESLQNRSAALTSQVDLATVTATLIGRGTRATSADPGFLDGLDGGWGALVSTGRVLSVVLGAGLPFLPLVLLTLAGRVVWRRRHPVTATT